MTSSSVQRIVTSFTNRLIVRSSFTIQCRHQHVRTATKYLDDSTFRLPTSRWSSLCLSSKFHDQTQSYRRPFDSFKQQQTQISSNPGSRKTNDAVTHRLLLPWQGSLSLLGNDIQQNRTINNYQRRYFFTSSNWQDKDSPYTIIGVRYTSAVICLLKHSLTYFFRDTLLTQLLTNSLLYTSHILSLASVVMPMQKPSKTPIIKVINAYHCLLLRLPTPSITTYFLS